MGKAMRKRVSVKKLPVRKRVLLPCVFLTDVLCSYRKIEKFVVMYRCFECPQYRRFEAEMDVEDERIMDEIDRERALFDAENRK